MGLGRAGLEIGEPVANTVQEVVMCENLHAYFLR